MTYAVGGTIQAADFNGFTGGGVGSGANVSGQLNTVLGTGYGNAGYGLTLVSNVSAGSTVAATNWASLINNLNMVRKHQSVASFTNLTVPTAGATISFISTLSSTIAAAYTNRNLFDNGGTGNYTVLNSATAAKTINVGNNTSGSNEMRWEVTLAAVDHFRFFFNAGGNITVYYVSFTNTGGTSRGTSIQTLAQTNFLQKSMYSNSYSARSGAGGSVNSDITTGGYYGVGTSGSPSIPLIITSTSYYSGDSVRLETWSNSTTGSYGANGNTITMRFMFTSSTVNAFNSSINISLTMGISVNAPSTAYMPRPYLTPSITQVV